MEYKFKIEIIRQKLKSKGKTQVELAKHLGITNSGITHMLQSNNIKTGTLEKIADFLDISITEFFVNGNGESLQTKLSQSELNEKKIEILKDSLLKAEYLIELQKRLIPQI